MYIDQQIGFGKFQFTRLRIQMGGVGTYIYDVGYEHVVRTESNYFLYPTFDAQGRLLDERSADNGAFAGCQFHLFELVIALARTHAAPIGGTRHIFRCQVDDKLHIAFDDVVRVAFRTYGDVAHGRVRANRPRPCNGQYIVFFRGAPATHQYSGERINHCSRFPIFFH